MVAETGRSSDLGAGEPDSKRSLGRLLRRLLDFAAFGNGENDQSLRAQIEDVIDEHDDAPEVLLRPLDDGMWDADARVELEEVAERVDPRLAVEDDIDTLGGLAVLLAEQVPEVGALLRHESGWTIEVTGADERHVTRLRLHPPTPPHGHASERSA